ncbi:MAG: hypothetical protein AMXMBFR64_28760 [Myxococcales bacterium]
MSAHALLDAATMARLSHLAVRTPRFVTGPLSGQHRSPLHGSSIEFAEHKEYSPGDEIRNINWRAYGKSDKYYVKRFEDETNLRAFLLVDASASMGYAGAGTSKLLFASRLAAALSFLLLKQQDQVAVLAYGDDVRAWVPPRATSAHLGIIEDALVGLEASGGTRLDVAVRTLMEHVGRRSLVYVLSDLFEDPATIGRHLGLLGTRHQITLLHVLDPHEVEFPFDELTLFKAMESDRQVMAEPRAIRDTYLRELGRHFDALRQTCLERGVTYARVDSGTPVADAVVALLGGKGGGRAL